VVRVRILRRTLEGILESAREAGGGAGCEKGDEKHGERKERREVIGLLFGRAAGDVVRVTDFNSDRRHSSPVHAELDDEFMAFSAQRVVERPSERVVGWWHSHPSYGCFMSDTDLKTQRKLERFGEVVALVVDPTRHLDFSFYACAEDGYHALTYAVVEELGDWAPDAP